MPPAHVRANVEMLGPVPQALWGPPAVANFVLGGLGGGLYVTAALAAGLGPSAAMTLASWLAPVLVVAGLAAVALEAGRPLRGARVLGRVATSWMSRELWLAGAFVALAAGELLVPGRAQRLAGLAAATGLALAQGFIVRRARGVPAWDVPVMPLVFLSSALVSGAGLLLLIEIGAGRGPDPASLGLTLALLAAGTLVWLVYVTWSRDPAFSRATGVLRHGYHPAAIVAGGHLLPLALIALALALPGVADGTAAIAAVLMIAGQIDAKRVLILKAGDLRPITLPHLRLSRRSP
jgi:anaerobic dimethyl sulfoxide reductase subunit C (anchor subunit)